MDKPREFWIEDRETITTIYDSETKETFKMKTGPCPYVHVIEKSAYDRLEKQIKILREALEHCRDFDTSAKFGYEYGQKVRGHIPEPGTRFKTPKEMAQQALSDAEEVE